MRKVAVVYHCEDGIWWAESPEAELSTFAATAESLEEVRHLAQDGLSFYLDEPEVQLVERYDQARPVLVNYLMESAAGIADAFTVGASGGQRSEFTPAQPHIIAC